MATFIKLQGGKLITVCKNLQGNDLVVFSDPTSRSKICMSLDAWGKFKEEIPRIEEAITASRRQDVSFGDRYAVNVNFDGFINDYRVVLTYTSASDALYDIAFDKLSWESLLSNTSNIDDALDMDKKMTKRTRSPSPMREDKKKKQMAKEQDAENVQYDITVVKLIMINFIVRKIFDLLRKYCHGCIIDHGSQKQHFEGCMADWTYGVCAYFEKAKNIISPKVVMDAYRKVKRRLNESANPYIYSIIMSVELMEDIRDEVENFDHEVGD